MSTTERCVGFTNLFTGTICSRWCFYGIYNRRIKCHSRSTVDVFLNCCCLTNLCDVIHLYCNSGATYAANTRNLNVNRTDWSHLNCIVKIRSLKNVKKKHQYTHDRKRNADFAAHYGTHHALLFLPWRGLS